MHGANLFRDAPTDQATVEPTKEEAVMLETYDPDPTLLSPAARHIIRAAYSAFACKGTRSIEAVLEGLLDAERLSKPVAQTMVYELPHETSYAGISDFLMATSTTTLLQAWATLTLTRNFQAIRTVDRDRLSHSFRMAAEEWTRRSSAPHSTDKVWNLQWRTIWTLITRRLDPLLERLHAVLTDNPESASRLHGAGLGIQLLRGSPTSSYSLDALELLCDPDRLASAARTSAEISRAARQRYAQLLFSHTYDEYRIDDSALYVNRTLDELRSNLTGDFIQSGSVLSSADISDRSRVARFAVVGDPGVGKSTLVRHISFELSTEKDLLFAPIIVICRDYTTSSSNSSMVEHISQSMMVEHSVRSAPEGVADLLVLGGACVVFDGVDELVDLATRRKLIERVESFAARYPLVSIIATSRKVGYRQAQFSAAMFRLVELSEFDFFQVQEYVERWFVLMRRSSEQAAFQKELAGLSDVSSNPLMLSLLCTLYRARGFIPRNRRQIYRDCADLLFRRWDAIRHIEQPFDHRHYGERLMEELARFYFMNQEAQAGIDEQTLVRYVAAYFRDTGDVDPPDDVRRARMFVDFCAGRAWLLSSRGTNDHGQRLFVFTHRTFMEYLAAESIVRISNNIEEIVDEIVSVFESDQSSVLPEVMTQAADEKFDRGAEKVVRHLLDLVRQKDSWYADPLLALCLRAINSSPMSRSVTESLPREMLQHWLRLGTIAGTQASTRALFSLPRDPRRRFLLAIPTRDADIAGLALRYELCKHWAAFIAAEPELLDSDWTADLAPHLAAVGSGYSEHAAAIKKQRARTGITALESTPLQDDTVLGDHLQRLGLLPPGANFGPIIMKPTLALESQWRSTAGSGFVALRNVLLSEETDLSQSLAQLAWLGDDFASWQPQSLADAERTLRIVDSHTWHLDKMRSREHLRAIFDVNPRAELAVIGVNLLLWEVDNRNDIETYLGSLRFGVSGHEISEYRHATNREKRRYIWSVVPASSAPLRKFLVAWLEGRSIIVRH